MCDADRKGSMNDIRNKYAELKGLEKDPWRWTACAASLCKMLDQVEMSNEVFDIYEYLLKYDNSAAKIADGTSGLAVSQRTWQKAKKDFMVYKTGMQIPYEPREEVLKRTCCIAAETPDALGVDPNTVYSWVGEQIQEAIDKGYGMFLLACDIECCCVAAEKITEKKKGSIAIRFVDIKSEVCREKDKEMDQAWYLRVQNAISQADCQIFVEGYIYDPKRLLIRNQWIVDHSQRVIAAYKDGESAEIVTYAEEKNREVCLY